VNFFSGYIVPDAVRTVAEGMDLERKLRQVDKLNDGEVERHMRRWKRANPYSSGTIHDLLDHIDHIAKVAGVEHVGLGSDYDGVSVLPKQLEDASSYPYITQGLLDRSYSEDEIQGILGGNLIRVLEKAEAVATKKP
jgi:membrane dipeptidase